MSVNQPLQMYADIKPGSEWKHHGGATYRIVCITNERSERPTKYPPTVVYENVTNKTLWSRPRSDWYRSFTKVD